MPIGSYIVAKGGFLYECADKKSEKNLQQFFSDFLIM